MPTWYKDNLITITMQPGDFQHGHIDPHFQDYEVWENMILWGSSELSFPRDLKYVEELK